MVVSFLLDRPFLWSYTGAATGAAKGAIEGAIGLVETDPGATW
jgi:hypothetical protein